MNASETGKKRSNRILKQLHLIRDRFKSLIHPNLPYTDRVRHLEQSMFLYSIANIVTVIIIGLFSFRLRGIAADIANIYEWCRSVHEDLKTVNQQLIAIKDLLQQLISFFR